MGDSTLYDDDILLWSEQQAAVIRRLGETRRDIPNELDIENVAEEIESVGRSELAAVQSHIQLILVHLIKLVVEPNADAVRHWHSEIVAFHTDMKRRYAASMRQRIDIDSLWRSACKQLLLAYEGEQHQIVAALPMKSMIGIDELLVEDIDGVQLVERLQQATKSRTG